MFRSILYEYPCPDNNVSCYPHEIDLSNGIYRIELWGSGTSNGGGYTTGIINIHQKLRVYAYLGGQEMPAGPFCGLGGYNGGGNSTKYGPSTGQYPGCRQSGGSGASDIRLIEGDLSSRIMVAGGSGGSSACNFVSFTKGGYGGSLNGGDGHYNSDWETPNSPGKGGGQENGGQGKNPGEFGIGGMAAATETTDCSGAGGGGYYGGGSGYHTEYTGTGGGGSSYISGHEGCLIHESNYIFESTYMINGETKMPSPKGGFHPLGHYGPGYLRITQLSVLCTMHQQSFQFFHVSSILIIIFKY